MKKEKINHFYNLNTWKEAHKLVLMVYEMTKQLPPNERNILVSQMIRAAISITSNIAEGFGRRGMKEKIQFYTIARASLVELQNQIIICKDLGYFTKAKSIMVWEQSVIVHKMINALISSLRKTP